MCGLLYVLTYSLYSYAEVNSHIEVRLEVILQVAIKTKLYIINIKQKFKLNFKFHSIPSGNVFLIRKIIGNLI